jgi:predicted GTPase
VATRHSHKLNYDSLPSHINILLFGPAGSGKSSLIKTFFRSLHGINAMPNDISNKLTIKKKTQNEGTTHFTGIVIKKGDEEEKSRESNKTAVGDQYKVTGSSIVVHDTRGQIWMDEREVE